MKYPKYPKDKKHAHNIRNTYVATVQYAEDNLQFHKFWMVANVFFASYLLFKLIVLNTTLC